HREKDRPANGFRTRLGGDAGRPRDAATGADDEHPPAGVGLAVDDILSRRKAAMASRRTVMADDRKRSSVARKRTTKKVLQEQQQQAERIRTIEAKIRGEARGES